MTDDRSKRRRLVADTEVIEGTEGGSDPDVQVFDLDGEVDAGPARGASEPSAPPRGERSNRIEGVSTTIWSGRELRDQLPHALRRSKQVTGSIDLDRTEAPAPPRRTRSATPVETVSTSEVSEQTGRYDGHPRRLAAPAASPAPLSPLAPLEQRPTELLAAQALERRSTDPRGRSISSGRAMVPAGGERGHPRVRDAAEELDRGQDFDEEGTGRSRRLLEAPLRITLEAVRQYSPDPRLMVLTRPESLAAEHYRVLALKLKEGRSVRRVVAVVAPTTEAEGPLCAVNLALALAEGRRTRVALLDADLRDGRLAGLLGLTEGPGLADQIRQHRDAPGEPWVLLALSDSLHVIVAGPAQKNPASLLNSEVLGDLITELRRTHDFIILATPPVIDSADVNILQDHVDGALLVVRAGITTKAAVVTSIARLGTRKFVGTVLTGVKGS